VLGRGYKAYELPRALLLGARASAGGHTPKELWGSLDNTLRQPICYDVVRKGLVTIEGGHYKMEMRRKATDPTVGELHCLFKGSGAG
jgi:hypothetical protein